MTRYCGIICFTADNMTIPPRFGFLELELSNLAMQCSSPFLSTNVDSASPKSVNQEEYLFLVFAIQFQGTSPCNREQYLLEACGSAASTAAISIF